MTIVYSNSTQLENLGRSPGIQGTNKAGNWSVVSIKNDAGGNNWLLEKGETFEMSAMPSYNVYKNDNIALELKPIVGASLGIDRKSVV